MRCNTCQYWNIPTGEKETMLCTNKMEEYGFTCNASDDIKCVKYKPVTTDWSLMPMGGKNHA